MQQLLRKIQDTVMKYADIISQMAQVDVEVVDNTLYRVAGTGIFRDKLNMDMSFEGHVYRQALKTGETMVIHNPGEEEICRDCPHCQNCRETIEISMPVRMGDQVIGVIGLVCSTQKQRQRIVDNEKLYLQFLEQIAEFISAKAQEYVLNASRTALMGALNGTMDRITQGVIILGQDGTITTANEIARQQLNIPQPEGLLVEVQATGDRLGDRDEYIVTVEERKSAVMGHFYPLPDATEKYANVLLFNISKDIQDLLYGITSTVQTVSCKNIIGSSEKTQKLKDHIMRVARSTSTVLITGESGTGKEMVATAIWNAGDRKDKNFVAINCAAIPEALLESELFGYVKGAFTGADPNGRIGKFELADKGVIFLDEIGDMPLYLQAKLLRVLQERKIVRIGSNQQIPIDVRILAATNKNLKEMIREKKFREDLYYRLNVIPMEISPLRERPEDIEELALHFAKRYAELFKKDFWKITEPVMDRIKSYPWEGNVRELENVMEFMVNMMGSDGVLNEQTLPRELQSTAFRRMPRPAPVQVPVAVREEKPERILTLKELEQREIRKAIAKHGSTTQGKKAAAKELGIGLATLYRKMEEMEKDSQTEKK